MQTKIAVPTELLLTKHREKITGFRYGKILEIDEDSGTIWIDYAENPLKQPLEAQLASPHLTLEDLKEATLKANIAQLEFIEGNPAKPLVRDIYFSLIEQVKEKQKAAKTFHLKADHIILEGEQSVIIKSGDVRSVFKGSDGRIVTEGEVIKSKATEKNIVQGGTVNIN